MGGTHTNRSSARADSFDSFRTERSAELNSVKSVGPDTQHARTGHHDPTQPPSHCNNAKRGTHGGTHVSELKHREDGNRGGHGRRRYQDDHVGDCHQSLTLSSLTPEISSVESET